MAAAAVSFYFPRDNALVFFQLSRPHDSKTGSPQALSNRIFNAVFAKMAYSTSARLV